MALGGIGLAMQAIGGASSAVGAYYGAKTQKLNLEGQANTADFNARISEIGAQSVLLAGQKQVADLTLKAGQLKSKQRVALAANGVDLAQGNAAELQASTDLMKELDVNTIQENAIRSAWGYRVEKTNYENQARTLRSGSSQVNPGLAASTSLLGSAGQVAAGWYSYNKAGS